ncbi:MAG: carbon monoxide dehydrogenase subunit G [Pseudomonadota bacterium]|nr:carbon monoxide dehydrogenase subunit G [Pseudomonadota bacterium]
MELSGDVLIEAPRAQVWLALNDPDVLRACIPGCEAVERVSPTETQLRAMIRTGPVRARFVGKIVMSDVRVDEGCVLSFEGSGGAAGFAKGSSTVRLATEASGTRLSYTAAASIGGKLGQVGGRMIDAAAKQMADQFFAAFGKHLAPAPATRATADVDPDAATASDVPALTSAPLPAVNRATGLSGEGVRVLWFVLGALATAFGFWVASALTH